MTHDKNILWVQLAHGAKCYLTYALNSSKLDKLVWPQKCAQRSTKCMLGANKRAIWRKRLNRYWYYWISSSFLILTAWVKILYLHINQLKLIIHFLRLRANTQATMIYHTVFSYSFVFLFSQGGGRFYCRVSLNTGNSLGLKKAKNWPKQFYFFPFFFKKKMLSFHVPNSNLIPKLLIFQQLLGLQEQRQTEGYTA